jgi:uncharacterized phage-associated protein
MKENEYKVHKINKISILNDEELNYRGREAICDKCENVIYVSDVCDYNLKKLYEEYKKKHNIISVIEVNSIIIKYCINDYALSLLLGWKSETISRYLDGDMVEDSHNDILEKIYSNPNYYLILLQSNKERISPVDYNKSRQAVKEILSKDNTEEKIDAVIKYLLIRCEDFTQFTLHKLLYYIQSFYYVFTNKFLFEEDCEAFISGPIYRSVLERYGRFGYEDANKGILANNKLKLDNVERNVVESIIKFYGCYSEKILRQMTQNEAPWILTRTSIINKNDFEDNDYSEIIEKNLISEYFKGIKEKYNMVNLLDIQKYSVDLFNNISM